MKLTRTERQGQAVIFLVARQHLPALRARHAHESVLGFSAKCFFPEAAEMSGICETSFLSDRGKRLGAQKRVGQIDHAAFEPGALDVSTNAVTLRISDGSGEGGHLVVVGAIWRQHRGPYGAVIQRHGWPTGQWDT